jgi:phosphoribosylglycinamide formyltransferase-1
LSTKNPLQLVVLISGNGSNLQAIIDEIEAGNLNASINAVISNRPDAFGLQRARLHDIPAIALDHSQFAEREQFDSQLQQEIDKYQPDVIILAGYMRILTSELIRYFSPNILNIHPSLLPKYQGLNTYQRALDNNETEHGVSIHVVTPELDAGPVILQASYPITDQDDIDSMQQKGHALEYQMYPQVIRWLSEKRLQLSASKPLFDDKPLEQPIRYHEN